MTDSLGFIPKGCSTICNCAKSMKYSSLYVTYEPNHTVRMPYSVWCQDETLISNTLLAALFSIRQCRPIQNNSIAFITNFADAYRQMQLKQRSELHLKFFTEASGHDKVYASQQGPQCGPLMICNGPYHLVYIVYSSSLTIPRRSFYGRTSFFQ